MKIGIRFCPELPVWGSQRTYAKEFIPRLIEGLPEPVVYSSLPVPLGFGGQWISEKNPLLRGGVLRRIVNTIYYQVTFRKRLLKARVDVLFCPFHNEGLVFPGKVRQILIVHDLVPLLFPQEYRASNFLWRTLYRLSVHNSWHIICVSDAGREDLIRYLHVPREKISVIYNGYAHPLFKPSLIRLQHILYVASGHSSHKNIPALLRAFARCALRETHQLRIIGVPHRRNTPEIEKLISILGLSGRAILLMHLSDEALHCEYARASLFVYPSLCEGFGLPLVEAMAYGVPVCAARCSAIPEVAGNAALYFDPSNPDDIARTMERVAGDVGLKYMLVAAGRANLERFSWTRSAEQCIKLLRTVQNEHSKVNS